MRVAFLFALVLLALGQYGCVDEPDFQPACDTCFTGARNGLLLLNEGQWTRNNASLDFYHAASGYSRASGIFSQQTGRPLGDVAQSMYQQGDTLYLVVNNSLRVYQLLLPDLELLGWLQLPRGASPRAMAIADNGMGYVCSLLDRQIYLFDPAALTSAGAPPVDSIRGENFMEDLVWRNNRLWVTAGNYTTGLENNTLLEVDPAAGQVVARYPLPGGNAGDLEPLETGQLAILSRGDYTPSQPAQIHLFDPQTRQLDTSVILSSSAYSLTSNADWLYTTVDSGITRLRLANYLLEERWLQPQDLGVAPRELLYELYWDPHHHNLWLTNAGVGAVNGELLQLDSTGAVVLRREAGLFPGALLALP